MKQGIIDKKDLSGFIDAIKKDCRFYGPVDKGTYVSLGEPASGKDIELDYSNLKMSLKDLFFPQCEALYTYEDDEIHEVPAPEEKVVIFGTRPCDARALVLMDKVFDSEDIKDPYYLQKRQNSTIVSIACTDPVETCFCTSFGGGPANAEGSDILAFDLEDRFLFEACSKKGEALMKANSALFKKPTKAQLKKRDEQASVAEKKVEKVEVKGLKKKLEDDFDSPFWESAARKCVGCSVCTYFCPTCHCFALFDEKAGLACVKVRNWDSCQTPAFTIEASGHNPRGSHGERMRQRVMHKFRYTVENFGETFCVGCGRCITNCPVNMDIRETLAGIIK